MSYAVASVAGSHLAERRVHSDTAARPDAAAATPVVRRPMRRRLLGLVANGLLLLCVLAFGLIALGPHVFGYRTATMLTGSMEPGIMVGDVVVTVPKPASDVKVGDVITYQIPIEDHRVETHRITKVTHRADGTIAIRTKGDANSNVDPWTAIIDSDTVWETTAVIPKLGTAIRTLRSATVQHGFIWIAFGGLLLLGLSLIWGAKTNEDSTDDPADTAEADLSDRNTQRAPTRTEGGLEHDRERTFPCQSRV